MTVPTTEQPATKRQSNRFAKGMAFLIPLAMIGCGVWLVGAVKDAREAARQSECQGRFNQIMFALINYHETYKCLPPAYIADESGKPKHSWRVLLLPFLDQHGVYKQYDFNEPWDGPTNRKLASKIYLPIFQCHSGPNYETSLMTDYVVITGPQTAFPGSRSVSFEDIRDGRENTILLVEIANSNIPWMEPRDLEFDEMSFVVNDPKRPSISGPHPRGPCVVFADRISAYSLDRTLRPETLKALTTIAGGEPVSKEKLIRPLADFHNRLAEE